MNSFCYPPCLRQLVPCCSVVVCLLLSGSVLVRVLLPYFVFPRDATLHSSPASSAVSPCISSCLPLVFLVFSLMCTFVATLFWVLVTHFFDFSSSIGFVFQRCFFKVRLLFPISLLPYVCVTICRHLEHFVGCFKC